MSDGGLLLFVGLSDGLHPCGELFRHAGKVFRTVLQHFLGAVEFGIGVRNL